ncbi:uncharacterized protein METZ01_LOCUS72583 [marine metagenome]|uniref:Prolyl 4-hydroxylase alpha subunit Fe(2+) 2OG dioxygenase domain-containing protein n=1 Tax=marine metagenome TaxID=408172 RepID=A0A381TV61_9ZZZZ
MSALQKLADKLTSPKTALRNHPDAREFHEKYPVVIKEDCLGHMSNQHIKSIILETGDAQGRKTNVKAIMTHWLMHKQETIFAEICTQALELAEKNGPHKIDMQTSECWGAVYREGDFTQSHDHWPQLWSWVYNVECCSECSPLVFPTSSYKISPKEGTMILFPAWVLHSVPSQTCNHDRIIIAGNIMNMQLNPV